MDVPVLCSPEEFITKSNEIIQPTFELGYHYIHSIYRKYEQIERKAQNESLANALDLGAAICSMMLRP
jgi:hypothetical protein